MQKVFPNRDYSKATEIKQESTPDAIELPTSHNWFNRENSCSRWNYDSIVTRTLKSFLKAISSREEIRAQNFDVLSVARKSFNWLQDFDCWETNEWVALDDVFTQLRATNTKDRNEPFDIKQRQVLQKCKMYVFSRWSPRESTGMERQSDETAEPVSAPEEQRNESNNMRKSACVKSCEWVLESDSLTSFTICTSYNLF